MYVTNESTDHDDTRPETPRGKGTKADFANHCDEALVLILKFSKESRVESGGCEKTTQTTPDR